jgi:peptidyl-prolyl cis-trans isomerase C
MRRIVPALMLASLVVVGCSKSTKKKGPVVAEGGGVAVTAEEFKAKLDEQSPFVRARYSTLDRKKEFLENLLRFELLALEAEKKGLDKDPEVQATLKKIMVQKLVRQAFDEGDKQAGLPDARKFYDEHKEEFVKPERVRVQLVWLDAPAGSPQRAARTADARRLLARVKAEEPRNPLAFSNVAREASQDTPTRASGGDAGYRTQDELASQYSRELAAAAFALKDPGQTSNLVETPKGLALLKLTARQAAINRSFDEVKDQLVARASREKRNRDFEEYVKGIRSKASITVNDAELEKIVVAASPGVDALRSAQGTESVPTTGSPAPAPAQGTPAR